MQSTQRAADRLSGRFEFSLGRDEMSAFAYANSPAMMLIQHGVDDYAAGRCCLLQGLFAGLPLAATAIEKHLKGLILLVDPTCNVRGALHNITRLAEIAARFELVDLATVAPMLERFAGHYRARYPDNERGPDGLGTLKELDELDQIIWSLVVVMPMPNELWLRSGIVAKVTHTALYPQAPVFPDERWIKERNLTLSVYLPVLFRSAVALAAWNAAARARSGPPPSPRGG